MNLILFLVLLTCLLTSVFWIIPKFASPKDQTAIQDWLKVAFPGVLLLITLIQTRAQDTSLIAFYLLVLALCLSGVYWWIPTYIPKEQQSNTISILFLVVNIAIILTNTLSPPMSPLSAYVGARRKFT